MECEHFNCYLGQIPHTESSGKRYTCDGSYNTLPTLLPKFGVNRERGNKSVLSRGKDYVTRIFENVLIIFQRENIIRRHESMSKRHKVETHSQIKRESLKEVNIANLS
jgi:hypothetical protein